MTILFSRQYMKGHPRSGENTYFVEKILNSLGIDYTHVDYLLNLKRWNAKSITDGRLTFEELESFWLGLNKTKKQKGHTVRAGFKNIKAGDAFDPRVWCGRPYTGSQIQFAPEITVKKVWDIEMIYDQDRNKLFSSDSNHPKEIFDDKLLSEIAHNDGLELEDFKNWFNLGFVGRIICWSEKIDYGKV